MEIEWRQIPGFEGYYEASNAGQVRSMDRTVDVVGGRGPKKRNFVGALRRSYTTGCGYPAVILHKSGRPYNLTIHRIVMLTFCGPSILEVNHIDGNRANNALHNLEYCTRKHNARHRAHVLLRQRGEENSASKLTNGQVVAIRADVRSQTIIAAEYGVSQTTIHNIKAGKTWRCVA